MDDSIKLLSFTMTACGAGIFGVSFAFTVDLKVQTLLLQIAIFVLLLGITGLLYRILDLLEEGSE